MISLTKLVGYQRFFVSRKHLTRPISDIAGTFLASSAEKMANLTGYGCGYDSMLRLRQKNRYSKSREESLKPLPGMARLGELPRP